MASLVIEKNNIYEMPNLELFPEILRELFYQRTPQTKLQTPQYKLKFVNRSLCPYKQIEQDLSHYLKVNINPEKYQVVMERIKNYTQESCICELILELIRFIEANLDIYTSLFEEMIMVVEQVRQMDSSDYEFKHEVVNKCSLMMYDSIAVLRSMRKQVVQLARVYHVPIYYDLENDKSVHFRSSLLRTYKNLLTIMNDFFILNEAFWIIRHHRSVDPEEETLVRMQYEYVQPTVNTKNENHQTNKTMATS